jgi:hypothetical protein
MRRILYVLGAVLLLLWFAYDHLLPPGLIPGRGFKEGPHPERPAVDTTVVAPVLPPPPPPR